MKINKRNVNEKTIETYILVMVLVVVLFIVVAQMFPLVTDAAEELNTSGFPLASFFMEGGALWYLVAAGLLFLVYRGLKGTGKK